MWKCLIILCLLLEILWIFHISFETLFEFLNEWIMNAFFPSIYLELRKTKRNGGMSGGLDWWYIQWSRTQYCLWYARTGHIDIMFQKGCLKWDVVCLTLPKISIGCQALHRQWSSGQRQRVSVWRSRVWIFPRSVKLPQFAFRFWPRTFLSLHRKWCNL